MSDNTKSVVYAFFPPRFVEVDRDFSPDINDCLDEAVERYKADGIAILIGEDALKDAQKVMEFARQFPDLEPKNTPDE
jgi:hypothetical protein